MTGAEILGLLTKALLTGAFSQISKRGTQGIIDLVAEEAKQAGNIFLEQDRETTEKLLYGKNRFYDPILANLKLAQRKGIAIVGPSGVGKTSLFNFIAGKPIIRPAGSSSERKHDYTFIGPKKFLVTDTPGSLIQVNLAKETFEYIERGKINVLILVMCHGYLDTMGIHDLRRPGQREPANSIESYLIQSQREEIEWIEDFVTRAELMTRKIPYIMVAINKMDQWLNYQREVIRYYQEGKIRSHIDALAKKCCRLDTSPSFHPIACTYNSFKGSSPDGGMSAESALLTLAIFRAEIRQRLEEIG